MLQIDGKMATEKVQILTCVFFKMSSDMPAFEFLVFVSDFVFWIELINLISRHSNSNFAHHNGIHRLLF